MKGVADLRALRIARRQSGARQRAMSAPDEPPVVIDG